MLFHSVCFALERRNFQDANTRLIELSTAADMLAYLKLDNDILSGYIFEKMGFPMACRIQMSTFTLDIV
jgi:hypothetical protein